MVLFLVVVNFTCPINWATTSYLNITTMSYKFVMLVVILFVFATCLFYSRTAFCQNAFETALNKKIDSLFNASVTTGSHRILFPNDVLGSIMTPSGFGGYGTAIFGGVGGIYPQVYSNGTPDLAASGGFCVGNPIKAVNFAGIVNMMDVHRFKDFSYSFILSRMIFTGSSISFGGIQLFPNKSQTDFPHATFYLAYSHAVQTIPSKSQGASALTYTIGIGNGRFLLKSIDDFVTGKGRHGTSIFGNVSYEIIKHVNLNAEWTGLNLACSAGLRPGKVPLSFGVGVTNLTHYSADTPGMIFSIGYPLSLTR